MLEEKSIFSAMISGSKLSKQMLIGLLLLMIEDQLMVLQSI